MPKKPTLWIIIALIVVAIAGVSFYLIHTSFVPSGGSASSSVNTVNYSCDHESKIVAAYASSSVTLTLSDGRTLILPQTRSGSGIRYEAGNGTNDDIVFVSEGNDAFMTENGTTTYNNCVAGNLEASTTASTSLTTFIGEGNTFNFNYPSQFSLSGGGTGYTTQWMQNTTSSGMLLAKVDILGSFEPNSNFQGATFTVGTSADPSAVANCLLQTNGNASTSTQVSINGVPFTEITYGDAGAGNFSDIVSYRTIRNNQCYAVEYVIRWTNILNYPSGTVSQFNETQIDNILNSIVQSFRFL